MVIKKIIEQISVFYPIVEESSHGFVTATNTCKITDRGKVMLTVHIMVVTCLCVVHEE